jgi:modulator of FtsH protease HflC
MRRLRLWTVPILIVLIAWGQSCFYTVDQGEFIQLTRFGESVAIHDGATSAGLHFKWPAPIESVRRIAERRLQIIDLPPTEPLTRDADEKGFGKTLTVDAFVCWQIPNVEAADRFLKSVGTVEQARRLLTPRINGRLTAVISNVPLVDLFGLFDRWHLHHHFRFITINNVTLAHFFGLPSDTPIENRSEAIRRKLLGLDPIGPNDKDDPLAETILRDYGIQIVDVRIRRLNYPEAALPSILDSISEQLNAKVTKIQTDGSQLANKIVEDAKLEAAKITKRAATDKKIIEETADRDAARIRLEAYALDKDFAIFWKRLKTFQEAMSKPGDTLLISGKHPLFDGILRPPVNEPKK